MILLHPTYFPNILQFSVMLNNDVCWETYDNYQKQTYRNRTFICTDRGKHLLSIPIVHVGGKNGRQRYRDVKLDNSYQWQRQHWRTLQTAYRTSPFFEFYEDEIEPLYSKQYDSLLDFNFKTMEVLTDCLQLSFSKNETASYELKPTNMEDYRFLVNAKEKPTAYFPSYIQVFGDRHGFIQNLSMLDLLFNVGPNSLEYLKNISLNSKNV